VGQHMWGMIGSVSEIDLDLGPVRYHFAFRDL
jgi:hypothetical protein